MVKQKIRRDPKEVFDLIVKEKNKKEIAKELGLSKTALANHLERLELSGHIKREGKYLIKVLQSSYLNPKVTKNRVSKKLNKRGHAFNFKILFPEEKDLREKDLVISELKKKKLEELGFGSYKFNKKKNTIWINKESLTIYSNNSYYSENALHSKFTAIRDIDNLIGDIKRKFNFRGVYGIEVFREHYGLIFNKFAEWCLGKGKKLYVKDKGNKAILWVDDSRKDDIGLKEFEGKDPMLMNRSDEYFDDVLITNEGKVDSSFILNGFEIATKQINQLTMAQVEGSKQLTEYAEQNREHLALIQDYRKESQHSREESKQNRVLIMELIKSINKK